MTTHNVLERLDGDAEIPPLVPKRSASSAKQLVAGAVLVLSVIGVLGFAATRYFGKKTIVEEPGGDVASTTATRVKFPDAPARPPMAASAPASDASALGRVRVPSIEPASDVHVQPIPLRPAPDAGPPKRRVPVGDEPPYTTSSSVERNVTAAAGQASGVAEAQSNLKRYETQLGELMGQLKGFAGQAAGRATAMPTAASTSGLPLFGSMERSSTATVMAGSLGDRSLTMPRGTTFTCALKTRVVTAASGFVGCQLQRNVFSDDRKVVLAERGSHLDGEYRVVQVRPGVTRIPVLWTRLRMPNGVTVELDSPATGALGESGIGGHIDNRWPERVGAALMLSLIQDAVQGAARTDSTNGSSTVVLSNTNGAGSKLAEKILETTINIPPLIYANEGSVVGVYVARDVDFSSVYRLVPQ